MLSCVDDDSPYAGIPTSCDDTIDPNYEASSDSWESPNPVNIPKRIVSYMSVWEFLRELNLRGILDMWHLPDAWKSLSQTLSEDRSDLHKDTVEDYKKAVDIIPRYGNDLTLLVAVVSGMVDFGRLLHDDNVGAIARGKWADVPLHTVMGPHSIPAPCPDITIGFKLSDVMLILATAIEHLKPFSCPAMDNPCILFPVFTLEAKEIRQASLYSHISNLHNGSTMLQNLREFHSLATSEHDCRQDFDGKVCVLTTSITVDIIKIGVHFTSMNAE